MCQPRVFVCLIKHTDFFLQEGKEFAESKSLMFMETSAKLNYQVSEIFNTVGELWLLHRSWGACCYTSFLGRLLVSLGQGGA